MPARVSSHSFIHSLTKRERKKWRLCSCLVQNGMEEKEKKSRKKEKERMRRTMTTRQHFSFFFFLLFDLTQIDYRWDDHLLLREAIAAVLLNSRSNNENNEKKVRTARTGARTLGLVVKSHTLYRLSYPGHVNTRTKWSHLFVFISRINSKYGKSHIYTWFYMIKTFKYSTRDRHSFFYILACVPYLR